MTWMAFGDRRRLDAAVPSGRPVPPRWSRRNVHTAVVRFLRLALPVAAVLLFLTVALWRDLVPNPQLIGLEEAALPASEVEELTMIRPRFDGLDKDGQPYTLTADRANQASEEGELIYLVQPAADITLTSGDWVAVSASGGRFYRLEKRLELEGNVSLFHDDGYELQTPAAEVDFDSGVIVSDAGVSGQGPRGELEAEGMRVTEDGKVVTLTGRSRVKILPAEAERSPS